MLPINQGGLGFKVLKIFNLVMLVIIVWSFIHINRPGAFYTSLFSNISHASPILSTSTFIKLGFPAQINLAQIAEQGNHQTLDFMFTFTFLVLLIIISLFKFKIPHKIHQEIKQTLSTEKLNWLVLQPLQSPPATMSSNPPNWSDLPPEIIALIARKFDSADDFFRFGGVCQSWRAITGDSTQFPLFGKPPFPWLMVSPSDKNDDTRDFVSPLDKHVCPLKLPELRGCRCWGSDYGWLVCLDLANGYAVTLLNPLTREIMCFPSLSRCHAVDIRKAVLSITYPENYGGGPDFKVFVIAGRAFEREVVFATYGETRWSSIELGAQVEDVVYRNSEVCMVDSKGYFRVYNGIYLKIHPTDFLGGRLNEELNNMVYLFELRGCMLMAVKNQRFNTREDLYETVSFQVFMLYDLAEWYPVETLGNYVVFVGDNASFAFNADDYPGFMPGCIYFTDDREENFGSSRPDVGVFNLEEQKFEESFYNGNDDLSRFSPPIWIKPSLSNP